MCGILGVLPSAEAGKFTAALNTLEHRGPDGLGIWEDGNNRVTLGHRRLAIIDLSPNGKQPMLWAGRYAITYNGEIYNYIELRAELEKKGVALKQIRIQKCCWLYIVWKAVRVCKS